MSKMSTKPDTKKTAAKPAAKTQSKSKTTMSKPPSGLSDRQQNRYQYTLKTKGKAAADKEAQGFLKRATQPDPAVKQQNQKDVNTQGTNYNYDSPEQATASGYDVNAQTAQANAKFNRPDQQGQFGGSQNWTQNPDGSWKKTTSLGADAQTQTDLGNQMTTMGRQAGVNSMGQAAQNYSQPYNYNGISQVMGGQQLGDARNKAASSAYESQMSLMRPEREQQNAQFEQMAAERGWVPGSKMYENEKTRMQNQQAAQDKSLAESSYNTGLNEYNTMFNTSTSDRSRQISEMNQMRDRPLQEAQSMFGAGPGPQIDQFADYGPVTQEGVDASKYYGVGMQGRMQTEQNAWQSKENILNRQNNIATAGAGRPAAAQGENLTAAQQIQLAQQQMEWERNNGFRPDYRNNPGGNSGASIGQSIGAGIGAGLGMGAGRALAG